jgi:hypothetical protein
MRMVEAMKQDSSNMVGEFFFFKEIWIIFLGVFVC